MQPMEIIIIEIIFLIIFVVLSAFFSGSETAIFSLKKSDLHRYSFSSDHLEKAIARSMINPQKILITILIGNLFVNLAFSALSTKLLLLKWQAYGHFISIALVTPFMIVFCEISPKVLAINSYESVSRKAYPVLKFFHYFFSPLRAFLLLITDTMIRIFNLELSHRMITEDELGIIVNAGEDEGVIDKDEGDIIKNVLRFSKKEASNIMFPRNHAVFIPWNATVKEAMDIFLDSDVIRAPVYRDDLDHVVGMIDSRELLPAYMGYKKTKKITGYIHDIHFFPASRELNDLLADFLEKRIQIAVVVDEYGGTAGIVTLNSILAVLMGKGFNRWEVDSKPDIIKIQHGVTVVSGDMQIVDFNFRFESELFSINADTIGGYFIEKNGHFPERGDMIEIDGYSLRVKSIRKNRVVSIDVIEISEGE